MKQDYYKFNSQVGVGSSFAQDVGNDEIKNEPMFFNSSLDYAYENGGPITKSFIENLPDFITIKPCVFDSRVHMLMPGWYPAIPGWHHDDVPRPPIPVGQHFLTAGQPNYDTPHYHSSHWLGVVNAHVAPTKFLIGDVILPGVPDGGLIYRKWNEEIEHQLNKNNTHLETLSVSDRTIYSFDCDTFHTGIKAVQNGWRWFGRVTINSDRCDTITNEIRRNAQVYLEFPMEGW